MLTKPVQTSSTQRHGRAVLTAFYHLCDGYQALSNAFDGESVRTFRRDSP
jgi:hypothetical protein